ncbi:hypothetical protein YASMINEVIRUS_1205 [Yasminevirus sp. GU-2018]|uniref:Uncharacterized protein n=1 Tax=Yasminevirus sp. GU-2018 TaxID=2420051 RepID=A0A5K0UAZ8_9VIRU|nr:hypothetical protein YASMINEVIRUS_1205 [Yasminevirus sp. GU-2018]
MSNGYIESDMRRVEDAIRDAFSSFRNFLVTDIPEIMDEDVDFFGLSTVSDPRGRQHTLQRQQIRPDPLFADFLNDGQFVRKVPKKPVAKLYPSPPCDLYENKNMSYSTNSSQAMGKHNSNTLRRRHVRAKTNETPQTVPSASKNQIETVGIYLVDNKKSVDSNKINYDHQNLDSSYISSFPPIDMGNNGKVSSHVNSRKTHQVNDVQNNNNNRETSCHEVVININDSDPYLVVPPTCAHSNKVPKNSNDVVLKRGYGIEVSPNMFECLHTEDAEIDKEVDLELGLYKGYVADKKENMSREDSESGSVSDSLSQKESYQEDYSQSNSSQEDLVQDDYEQHEVASPSLPTDTSIVNESEAVAEIQPQSDSNTVVEAVVEPIVESSADLTDKTNDVVEQSVEDEDHTKSTPVVNTIQENPERDSAPVPVLNVSHIVTVDDYITEQEPQANTPTEDSDESSRVLTDASVRTLAEALAEALTDTITDVNSNITPSIKADHEPEQTELHVSDLMSDAVSDDVVDESVNKSVNQTSGVNESTHECNDVENGSSQIVSFELNATEVGEETKHTHELVGVLTIDDLAVDDVCDDDFSSESGDKKIEITNIEINYSDSCINSPVKDTSREESVIMSATKSTNSVTGAEKNADPVSTAKAIVDEINAIVKRFHVLKDLQGGQKIWIEVVPATDSTPETKVFKIDTSYVPSFSRWWWGQGREQIINTIIDDTNFIYDNFPKIKSQDSKNIVCRAAEVALTGIRNMRQTYSSNEDHFTKLGKVIEVLETYAAMLKKPTAV